MKISLASRPDGRMSPVPIPPEVVGYDLGSVLWSTNFTRNRNTGAEDPALWNKAGKIASTSVQRFIADNEAYPIRLDQFLGDPAKFAVNIAMHRRSIEWARQFAEIRVGAYQVDSTGMHRYHHTAAQYLDWQKRIKSTLDLDFDLVEFYGLESAAGGGEDSAFLSLCDKINLYNTYPSPHRTALVSQYWYDKNQAERPSSHGLFTKTCRLLDSEGFDICVWNWTGDWNWIKELAGH